MLRVEFDDELGCLVEKGTKNPFNGTRICPIIVGKTKEQIFRFNAGRGLPKEAIEDLEKQAEERGANAYELLNTNLITTKVTPFGHSFDQHGYSEAIGILYTKTK